MKRLPRVNVSLRADSVLPGRATDEVVALAFEEDALGGRPFVCAAIDDHVRLMDASIVFGDTVCAGFDPETGEDRDVTDAEAQRVMDRFGSDESIESGGLELVRMMMHGRVAG